MRERGQILLFTLTLLIFVGAASFFTFFSPSSSRLRQDEQTTKLMAEAKEALIGYAASSPTLPGQLPCPDTNNDGLAEAFSGGFCPSDIGRLPWKTLGLPDLRDGAGERLWYAASKDFTRDLSTFSCESDCFDSDTKGGLTVYQNTKAAEITREAVAIIFAPGAAFGGQIRNVANLNSAANYLDTMDTVNNATGTQNPPPAPRVPTFIAAQLGDTFNDRLVVIDTVALWTVVEKRLAREILKDLTAYRNATGYYPWASGTFDDDSNTGQRRGMAPMEDALPQPWSVVPSPFPGIPSYIKGSKAKWGRLIYYAVAECATDGASPPPACTTLTVDGASKDLVIIMPGPAGASRPSTNLTDYFEDSENRDNDDQFVTPSSNAYARDRIYFCPGTPGIC